MARGRAGRNNSADGSSPGPLESRPTNGDLQENDNRKRNAEVSPSEAHSSEIYTFPLKADGKHGVQVGQQSDKGVPPPPSSPPSVSPAAPPSSEWLNQVTQLLSKMSQLSSSGVSDSVGDESIQALFRQASELQSSLAQYPPLVASPTPSSGGSAPPSAPPSDNTTPLVVHQPQPLKAHGPVPILSIPHVHIPPSPIATSYALSPSPPPTGQAGAVFSPAPSAKAATSPSPHRTSSDPLSSHSLRKRTGSLDVHVDPPMLPIDDEEAVSDVSQKQNKQTKTQGGAGADTTTGVVSTHTAVAPHSKEGFSPSEVESKQVDVALMFSSPLVKKSKRGQLHPVDSLAQSRERRLLLDSLAEANRIIRVSMVPGNTDRLRLLLSSGCRVLHFSGHGIVDSSGTDYLVFEDKNGAAHFVSMDALHRLVKAGSDTLDLVFVAACRSKRLGQTFIAAGARFVVCVQREALIMDDATITFSRAFYHALFSGSTVYDAFEIGQARVASESGIPDSETDKFVLLTHPKQEISKQNAKLAFFDDLKPGMWKDVTPVPKFHVLPAKATTFVGREADLHNILQLVNQHRFVTLRGPPGMGKTSIVKALSSYVLDRRVFQDGILYCGMRGCTNAQEVYVAILRALKTNRAVRGQYSDKDARKHVFETLRDCHVLLVWDNCEDAINSDASEFREVLQDVLENTLHSRVVTTSRVALGGGVRDVTEKVYSLQPLSPLAAARLFTQHCPRQITVAELTNPCVSEVDAAVVGVTVPVPSSARKGEKPNESSSDEDGDSGSDEADSNSENDEENTQHRRNSSRQRTPGGGGGRRPSPPNGNATAPGSLTTTPRASPRPRPQIRTAQDALECLARHPVMKFLGGHPQSISLAAPLAQDRTLDELDELLATKSLDALLLGGTREDERSTVSTLVTSLEASIDALRKRHKLTVDFFCLMALFPSGGIDIDFLKVWGEDWKDHVHTLLNASLIVRVQWRMRSKVVTKYTTYPFITKYAERLLMEKPKLCRRLVSACRSHFALVSDRIFRQIGTGTHESSIVYLQLEFYEQNVFAALRFWPAVDSRPRPLPDTPGAVHITKMGVLLSTFASCLYLAGRYEASRRVAEMGLSVVDRLNDRIGEANLKKLLAVVDYRQAKHLESSNVMLKEALQLYTRSGSHLGCGITNNLLGYVQNKLQLFDEARKHYMKAIKSFEMLDHTAGLVNTYRWLATICRHIPGGKTESHGYYLTAKRVQAMLAKKNQRLGAQATMARWNGADLTLHLQIPTSAEEMGVQKKSVHGRNQSAVDSQSAFSRRQEYDRTSKSLLQHKPRSGSGISTSSNSNNNIHSSSSTSGTYLGRRVHTMPSPSKNAITSENMWQFKSQPIPGEEKNADYKNTLVLDRPVSVASTPRSSFAYSDVSSHVSESELQRQKVEQEIEREISNRPPRRPSSAALALVSSASAEKRSQRVSSASLSERSASESRSEDVPVESRATEEKEKRVVEEAEETTLVSTSNATVVSAQLHERQSLTTPLVGVGDSLSCTETDEVSSDADESQQKIRPKQPHDGSKPVRFGSTRSNTGRSSTISSSTVAGEVSTPSPTSVSTRKTAGSPRSVASPRRISLASAQNNSLSSPLRKKRVPTTKSDPVKSILKKKSSTASSSSTSLKSGARVSIIKSSSTRLPSSPLRKNKGSTPTRSRRHTRSRSSVEFSDMAATNGPIPPESPSKNMARTGSSTPLPRVALLWKKGTAKTSAPHNGDSAPSSAVSRSRSRGKMKGKRKKSASRRSKSSPVVLSDAKNRWKKAISSVVQSLRKAKGEK